jgi:uncharacterized delta-60 repeat protein
MKPFPAGILFASLLFAAPLAPLVFAEESADQLADQTLGPDNNQQDESAEQLAKQQGDAINPNSDPDQSAEDLAKKQGVAIDPSTDPDESAAQLAKQQGLAIDPNTEADESASHLAKKDGLEKKNKIVASPSQSVFTGGEGVDGSVYAVAALADGSAIIGGRFTSVNGQPRSNLARIKADGTLDPKFLAAATDGVVGAVYALAFDANGNLLVGGYFSSAQGQTAQNFVRYLASGTLDTSFNGSQNPNGAVFAIAVQPNGKILVGGQFSTVGDTPRRNLARFNADGTLDAPVTSATVGAGSVRSLAVLADGSVVAGGTFEIPGQTAQNLLHAQP